MKNTKRTSKTVARFPRKTLKIKAIARKGGVTPTLVNGLLKTATKNPGTAFIVVKVARLLARGKFRRAYKMSTKVNALRAAQPAISRGLKTINPRFYAKHVAA